MAEPAVAMDIDLNKLEKTKSTTKGDSSIDNQNDTDYITIKKEIYEEDDIIQIPVGISAAQLIYSKAEVEEEHHIMEIPGDTEQLICKKEATTDIWTDNYFDEDLESKKLQQITNKKKENIPKSNVLEENKNVSSQKVKEYKNLEDKSSLKVIKKTSKEKNYLDGNKPKKKLSSRSSGKSDLKTQTSYKCDFCDFTCSKKEYLFKHNKRHTGEKAYKCDLCHYSCIRKDVLDRHRRIHSSEKPYKCKTCDFRCSQKNNLVRHLSKHTGEKRYKCDTCDYACIQKVDLVKHIRSHTGEKPYKCDLCNLKCSQQSTLYQHLKIHARDTDKT